MNFAPWEILIIVFIAILIGFIIYKFIPFNYTPNVIPFWRSNFEELDLINKELAAEDITQEREQELLNRRKNIYKILDQFFGTDYAGI